MSNVLDLCHFLEGWEEASGADEASDGAWWAMLEEGVDAYNEEEGTKFDRNNGVHFYVNYLHKKQEQQR